MTDDFIASLKADWDRQTAETQVILLRRRRWTPHLLLAADALGAIALTAGGLGFATAAVRFGDLLYVLSAIAMLLFALPLVLVGIRMRWRALDWDDETSAGVLASYLRRLGATEQIVRLSRRGAYTLLALAGAVWMGEGAGIIRQPTPILAVITGTWMMAGAIWLCWVRSRLARIGRERRGCEALLRQFEGA
jgi:hypothetical protein